MRGLLRAALFVALLGGCAAAPPLTANRIEPPDCLRKAQTVEAGVAACRAAAAQGYATAQHNLGFMYANGEGVQQNYAEALVWYRRAAGQGCAAAQNNLGLMYVNGEGVPQDYAEALVWFRQAAEQGFAAGQYNLGLMYAKGEGIPEDYVLAHMWLNLAVAGGYKDAIEGRDLVAELMTPTLIAEAQRMAREWMEKHGAGTE